MCAICDLRIEFGVDHPMSLSVAVATRRAIDAGLLPPAAGQAGPSGGAQFRLDAIAVLKAVQRRLEDSLSPMELAALPDFFVLLIESRTWAFFHPTAAGFDPNCRPEPPRIAADDARDRDAVIVASAAAMRQLLSGTLPFERALAEELVVVDADDSRQLTLNRAGSAGFPGKGFSRFICTSWASPRFHQSMAAE